MNLKNKYQSFERELRKLTKVYEDKIRFGSKNPEDYMNLSYFTGVHNGFKLAFQPLDHDMSETDFNEMRDRVLQRTPLEVN